MKEEVIAEGFARFEGDVEFFVNAGKLGTQRGLEESEDRQGPASPSG